MDRVKVIKVYPALLMLSMFAGDLLSSMLGLLWRDLVLLVFLVPFGIFFFLLFSEPRKC